MPREILAAAQARDFQGHTERGFDQLQLVKDVPAYGRRLELDGLKGLFQPKL